MSTLETTHQLVEKLAERGIHLWLEGEGLRYRAPRNVLTQELRQELGRRKSEILDLLRRRRNVAPRSPASRIEPDRKARHQPFPLTEIQQAYWVGRSDAFALNLSAHLYKEREFHELDLERLKRAWSRMLARHEMLRAEITADGQQRILERVPDFELPLVDLRDLDEPQAERELATLRRRMKRVGPSLESYPLWELQATLRADGLIHLHFTLSLLICDALSSDIFFRQLLQLYQSPDLPLPELELSFRDYVVAMNTESARAARDRSLEYWRQRLDSLPGAPELPLVRDPQHLRRPRFTRFWGRLAPALCSRLKERVRSSGLTLTALMAAAFAEIVARWCKDQHLLLNILFFNRPLLHPQINQILGNFSTTILLEVDLRRRDSTFEDRARQLQEQLWSDIEHAQASGIEVLRELHRKRGSENRSAVPVVLASTIGLTTPTGTILGAEEEERPEYDSLQTPQVWLDHQIGERDGGLFYNWDGAVELFPPGLVQDMFDAYARLLEQLAVDEESWQRTTLELLPENQILRRRQANDTFVELDDGMLHTRVAAQEMRRGNRLAVIDGDRRLTYRQLMRLARHYGRRLRELGVVPGELVAVMMTKGWEQIVAVLAIHEAGGAYLPIEAGLPRQRRSLLLEHAEARIALVQPDMEGEETGVVQISIGPEIEVASGEELTAEPARQTPDDLAYVIYTSGSTGQPKGVMISHRAAVNTLLDIDRRFGIGPEDRVLALSSLSFDLSVYDVFGILGAGGTVVLPEPTPVPEPARWSAVVAEHDVTVWNSVPALMEMLVDDLEGQDRGLPPSLRLILLSGDWIPLRLPERIRKLAPNVRVISLGGATEASIWSIYHPIEEIDPGWASIPYGRPLANQAFHVLNERLEDCPDWVTGQLYIEGSGLAMGYWRDEDKTRASFFVHPRTGRRIYRTGDLGRYLPTGELEILGREDFQVKVQGYRIELGEIETILADHPQVRAAVAITVGEDRGSKRLVAFATLKSPDSEVDAESLRRYLAARLPDYMVPSRLTLLAELPLTANGKVDRGTLTALEEKGDLETDDFLAPRDGLELRLAEIWQEVLERPMVGVRSSFFDLGGHSLSAVRMTSLIRQRLEAEVPLSALFEAPTIERLATRLRRDRSGPPERSSLVRIRAGEGTPFFCVHPVSGSVLCYLELAHEMSGATPFLALQVADPEEAQSDGATLPEIAARYLSAVRREQPEGPYLLGGWSMGGVIAYEMARQLEDAGESAAAVVIIDAVRPGAEATTDVDDSILASWFARDLGGISGRTIDLDPDVLRELAAPAQSARLYEVLHDAGLVKDIDQAQVERLLGVFRRNYRALLSYRPPSYGGSLLLLRAQAREGEAVGEDLGWDGLAAGGTRIETIPGDHYSVMRTPHVLELGQRLSDYLAACQEYENGGDRLATTSAPSTPAATGKASDSPTDSAQER